MISLKAAKPGFIGTNSQKHITVSNIENIRQLILNSIKFVFDKSLLDLSDTDEVAPLDILRLIAQTKDSEKTSPDKIIAKLKDKQFPIWKKYGTKLPYPVVFFENETGGFLLIQEEKKISCITISPIGFIGYIMLTLGEEFFNNDSYDLPIQYSFGSKLENAILGELANEVKVIATIMGLMVYKLITFINAQNVSIVKCKPTNKEFDKAKITNVTKPKYVYNVVDIYNTKKQYKSLKELGKFINTPVNKDIRAHMVKGHFKTRATGAYWWNNFIRCKDGSGKVIKHYEVHD